MAEERYREFFIEADSDNSGYLTVHELVCMLKKNGYTGDEEAIKCHFTSADKSDDDKISYDEFMEAMGCQNQNVHSAATMRAVFRKFDVDGSGSIDRNELQNALNDLGTRLSQEEVDRIIELADRDNSQCLNYEEFAKELFG